MVNPDSWEKATIDRLKVPDFIRKTRAEIGSYCPEMAIRLANEFRGAQIMGITIWAAEAGGKPHHYIVKIGDRYYDADNPEGTTTLNELIRRRYGYMTLFSETKRKTVAQVKAERGL